MFINLMTGKEKIEAAFSQNGSPEMAVVIPYEGIYYRDHIDELTDCPWWYFYDTNLDNQFLWYREAALNTPQDWFNMPFSYTREERKNIEIKEEKGKVLRINRKTGKIEEIAKPIKGGWNPAGGSHSIHIPNPPLTINELNAKIGNPSHNKKIPLGGEELIKLIMQDFGKNRIPLHHIGSPLWLCYGIWGFELMMMLIADNPKLVEHACKLFFEHQKFNVHILAEAGAKLIWIEECMTDMISPQMFEQFNIPYVSALVDEIRKEGMKSIYYYCGNPEGKLDLILSAGADALSFEESKKTFKINIIEMAEKINGRAVLFGNLDAVNVLERGNEETLAIAVQEQKNAYKTTKKRFIMSLGSPVTALTSVSRVKEYFRLSRTTT